MFKIVDKKVYKTQMEELELYKRLVAQYKNRCEIDDNVIAQQDIYIKGLKDRILYLVNELENLYMEKAGEEW